MIYTDIGHNDPNDIMWILIRWDLKTSRAGETGTHKWAWGLEANIEDCWRGRYEVKTGRCSIVPPQDKTPYESSRLPSAIHDTLTAAFSVSKFFFFVDGVHEISPNPRLRPAIRS